MDIDQIVQEKIDKDEQFQASLAELGDDEREQLLSQKRKEVLSNEFATLKALADEKTKAEELANNYKARAEKAEGKIKEQSEGLSAKDALLLAKANVNLEDVDEVVEYAQFKKIPIAEALKSSILKGMLAEREEQRKTAQATATGRQQQQAGTESEASILAKASGGQVPDDEAGIARLTEARINQKLKKG